MIRALILFFTLLCLTALATPVTVSLQPSATVLAPDQIVTIDVAIAGLGDASAPSLGGYDLTVSFPNSFTPVGDAVFGDPVLGNQLDFGFGSLFFSVPGSDLITLFEISFEDPSTLNSLQASAFVLAQFQLRATAPGVTMLEISGLLTDAIGDPIEFQTEGTRMTVIPEPATAGLTLMAALAVGMASIRRQRRIS